MLTNVSPLENFSSWIGMDALLLAYCLYLTCEKVKQLVLLRTVNKSPETGHPISLTLSFSQVLKKINHSLASIPMNLTSKWWTFPVSKQVVFSTWAPAWGGALKPSPPCRGPGKLCLGYFLEKLHSTWKHAGLPVHFN